MRFRSSPEQQCDSGGPDPSTAMALVAALDACDLFTARHSVAVAIYARDIATDLGLSAANVQLVYLAGLLHDLGKMGLPAGLIAKPGALTLDERREMQRHPMIGERIIAMAAGYEQVAVAVRFAACAAVCIARSVFSSWICATASARSVSPAFLSV